MLRMCKSFIPRSFLQPRMITVSNQSAGMKLSLEEKLGLPAKPKRPLSVYLKFLAKVRPVLVEKYPNAKITEIARIAGEHWSRADPAVRKQLEDDYKKEMEVFTKQIEHYNNTLTDTQKLQISEAKHEIKERKGKLEMKKRLHDMGKPKKPPTPFMSYFSDRMSSRSEDEPFRQFQKQVVKEWENLDEKSKSEYSKTFAKRLELYKRELQKWEEKMIRLGHIDLVRNEALMEPTAETLKKPSKREK